MKKILLLISTFFNIGKFPIAPGTLTSLVTTCIFYVYNYYLEPPLYIILTSIVLVFLIGIPASHYAEKYFKKKDPRPCVIDEVAGQMISLILVPVSIFPYIAGFFLFRFFDIIKPYPVKKAEKISGGFGIMLDDIIAGLYALGFLHLFLYITRA